MGVVVVIVKQATISNKKKKKMSDRGSELVDLTCGGEGDLVIIPIGGHADSHLHLLQQGRVDV